MDLDPRGTSGPTPTDPPACYGYFVLQTRSDQAGVTGVLENLTTGEKRRFGSGDELLACVRGWTAAGPPPAAPDGGAPSHPPLGPMNVWPKGGPL